MSLAGGPCSLSPHCTALYPEADWNKMYPGTRQCRDNVIHVPTRDESYYLILASFYLPLLLFHLFYSKIFTYLFYKFEDECMYVHHIHIHRSPQRSEEGIRSPATSVIGTVSIRVGANLDPLLE